MGNISQTFECVTAPPSDQPNADSGYSAGNSFHQKKMGPEDLLQTLKILTSDECYQQACHLMQNIPDENSDHLTEFLTTLVSHLQQQQLHQVKAKPQIPPPPVIKEMKVFLVITANTYGAHQQFLAQLNSQRSKVITTENLQLCDVILLFCPIVSRVGSDVEAAVKKIPDGASKPVVLILMHHTRKPDQVLDQIQWSKTFTCLNLVVHVLYHETKNGLLQCPRNQDAVETLQSMSDRYAHEKQLQTRTGTKRAEQD